MFAHSGLTRFRQIDPNTYVDEWRITWRTGEHGISYAVEHPIEQESDLEGYQAPDPDADDRLGSLELAVKRFKNRKCIVFLSRETFEFSRYLRGMDMARVKAAYGSRIALAGNVDCGQLLPFAMPAEVGEAVKETIAKGAVKGLHGAL